MSALTLSSIIFVLMLSGIFLGTLLRRGLPEHHLDEHAKDVVRLGVGLIATIAALALGLLIAAAKSSFDTQTSQLRQITADLTPFLAVLAFWLMIIFASLSLFSPMNVTVVTCLFLFALSAACAVFLILELSRPFTGLMSISSAPLRNALGTI
jgi:hypothetical protein